MSLKIPPRDVGEAPIFDNIVGFVLIVCLIVILVVGLIKLF